MMSKLNHEKTINENEFYHSIHCALAEYYAPCSCLKKWNNSKIRLFTNEKESVLSSYASSSD